MLIDSHCHLTEAQFANDLDTVIQRAHDAGVVAMVCAGADIASSGAAVKLAEQYESVYAVVGIHPEAADTYNADAIKTIRELAVHPKVVGIGEIGLDFYWKDNAPRDVQEKNFLAHLDLAQDLGLPVVIHDRDAHDALMEILRTRKGVPSTASSTRYARSESARGANAPAKGVLHCFSGDLVMAREAIDLGFYISFAGNLTFQNARPLHEIAAAVPLERVVIETDAPYLAPMPQRGKRNEPAYVVRAAEKIAQIKNLPLAVVQETTMRNSENIFRLHERIV